MSNKTFRFHAYTHIHTYDPTREYTHIYALKQCTLVYHVICTLFRKRKQHFLCMVTYSSLSAAAHEDRPHNAIYFRLLLRTLPCEATAVGCTGSRWPQARANEESSATGGCGPAASSGPARSGAPITLRPDSCCVEIIALGCTEHFASALITQVGPVTTSARAAKPQEVGSYRNRSLVFGSGAQGLIRSHAGIPSSRCAFSKRCHVARARSSKILKTSQI